MTQNQKSYCISEFKEKCLPKKKSLPITMEDKRYCLTFVKKNCKDFNGAMTNNMQFILRSFLKRLKCSTYSTYKLYKYNEDPESWASIEDTKAFLGNFMDELIKGCYPGNSVTRFSLYLDIIKSVIEELGLSKCTMPSGFNADHCLPNKIPEFPFSLDFLYPEELIDTLLESLKSSFEIVRETILPLLISHFLPRLKSKAPFIRDQAMQLIMSFRSNEAKSGASYLYLLNFLQPMEIENVAYYKILVMHIQLIKVDLLKASRHSNIEGYLIYFKRLINENRFTLNLDDYYPHFRTIVDVTMPIVASLCPEGNEFDFVSDDNSPVSQLILSFSWRNVTLASNLLEESLKNLKGNNSKVINVFFKDLVALATNIRHCGAFANICPILSSMTQICINSNLNQLPLDILQLYLNEYIYSNENTTRRSAGIPQSVMALLSALNTEKHTCAVIMTCISTINKQISDVSVIHSMNILESVFHETCFGSHVFPLVGQGFKIAISNLGHDSWRIRNCALMLFSALIRRGFGSNLRTWTNGCTSLEFFKRFPILDDIKLALHSKYNSSIFACLLLLCKFVKRKDIFAPEAFVGLEPILMELISNTDFKLRVFAAKALVLVLKDVYPFLNFVKNPNQMHGQLTTVLEYTRIHKERIDVNRIIDALNSLYLADIDSTTKSVIFMIYKTLDRLPAYLDDEFNKLMDIKDEPLLSAVVFDMKMSSGEQINNLFNLIENGANIVYKERMRYLIEEALNIEQNHNLFFHHVPFECDLKIEIIVDLEMIKSVKSSSCVTSFIYKNLDIYVDALKTGQFMTNEPFLVILCDVLNGHKSANALIPELSSMLKWENSFDQRILGVYALTYIVQSSFVEDLKLEIFGNCAYYCILDEEATIRGLGIAIAESFIDINDCVDEFEIYAKLLSKLDFESRETIISQHLKSIHEIDTDALFPTEFPNVYFEEIYFYSALKNILKLPLIDIDIPKNKTIRNDLYARRYAVRHWINK